MNNSVGKRTTSLPNSWDINALDYIYNPISSYSGINCLILYSNMFFISLSPISLIIHRNYGCSTIYEQLGFTQFSLFLLLLRFNLIKLYHAEIYIHKLLQKQIFLLDVQFISSASFCDRSLIFSSPIHIYMNVKFRNMIAIVAWLVCWLLSSSEKQDAYFTSKYGFQDYTNYF